ncbi:MAG: energy transducer TonB [Deltaproteobacteria bacterium]|nr:energy transducer TonB [Deltaproteobacteria bacterium]
MKGLRGTPGPLQSDRAGLLKAGAIALFFHMVMLAFLSLSFGSGGGSSIYRFTIRPYSPAGDGMAKGGSHPGLVRSPSAEKARLAKTASQEKSAAQKIKQGISLDGQRQPLQRHEAALAITVAAVAKDAQGAEPTPPPLSVQARGSSVDAGMGQAGKGLGQGSGMGQGGSGSGLGEGEEGFGWGWSGVSSPRYAQNPKPVYPQEAREKGYQGKVLLRVEVLANGRVGQVALKKSSGCEVLDRSALAAVKEWRFIPARKGEVAVPVLVIIPIKFQLL